MNHRKKNNQNDSRTLRDRAGNSTLLEERKQQDIRKRSRKDANNEKNT